MQLEPGAAGASGAMGDGVAAGVQRDVVADDGGAPAPGGSSSSSGEPSTETSACEQRREGAEGTRKRRRVGESSSVQGDEEFESSEVADAINRFTEAYVKIESSKLETKKMLMDHESKTKKMVMEHESRLAAMRMEAKELRYKSMLETQLAMAKLIAEAVNVALHRCLDTRDTRDA